MFIGAMYTGATCFRRPFPAALPVLLILAACAAHTPTTAPANTSAAASGRPRLLVTTDIGGDPDDQQSMVRLLVHANEFDIEGLIASASGTPGELDHSIIRPDLIHEMIAAYGDVYASLVKHSADFPTAQQLTDVVKAGNPHRGTDFVGEGHDTEASGWIIKVVDRPDPRPVDVALWGGQTDLAQALWRVRAQRGEAGLKDFMGRMRIHDIADQDGILDWMHGEFPGLWYILDKSRDDEKCHAAFRGMFLGGDTDLVTPGWVAENVKTNHGPLGALYPADRLWTCGNGVNGLKEGDTPSWFYFWRHGVNDPAQPEWGGFGGRFRRQGDLFIGDPDTVGDDTSDMATVYRWRQHYQNSFAARLDWCVNPPERANHEPLAVVQKQNGRAIVKVDGRAGETVSLSAMGSSDPDGNALSFAWWIYSEAGKNTGTASIDAANSDQATVHIPAGASGSEMHVILEVSDNGTPPLSALRRVIVRVP